jgi:hypothetical protein
VSNESPADVNVVGGARRELVFMTDGSAGYAAPGASSTAPWSVAHPILPGTAGTDNVSQLHALVAADVNGDGSTDLIAGKRYYAHPSSHPAGTEDPARPSCTFESERERRSLHVGEHLRTTADLVSTRSRSSSPRLIVFTDGVTDVGREHR